MAKRGKRKSKKVVKRKSKYAPYGLRKDGKPKRKPGRKKHRK